MKKPLLTVAIPTLGRDRVLVNTIQDLLKQDFDAFELLVIDQTLKHDNDTQQFFANLNDPRFRYFQVGPPSLPAARNFAIQEAKAEIILFLDDDIEIHDPKFLSHHYQAFQQDPEIVAVAGRVIDKGGLFVQHQTETPLYHDRYGMGHDSFNCPNSQYGSDVPGGNVALKTSAIAAVGGFDPSFRANAIREESDAAHRLVRAGGKIYFEAQAAIIHLAAPSGGARISVHPFDNQMFYSNDLLFAFKSVQLRYLPLALAKRYYSAIRGASVSKILRRSWLFLLGIFIALRFRFWPAHTVQHPLEATK